MNSSTNGSRPNATRIWMRRILFLLLLVILVASGGYGYTYWNQKTAVQAEQAANRVTTKLVRKGSITLAASGSVTLVASKENALAFTVSGTVAKLNVAVGDTVKKDQVLAQLDNLEDLHANIKSAEQDLLSAQQDLATLKSKAEANLANAKLAVIDAQKAVDDAEGSVLTKNDQRCTAETKASYYSRYERAIDKLDQLGDGGGNADYVLNVLNPQKKIIAQAKYLYDMCAAGYTQYEVLSSQGNLSLAQAELKQAQDTLDTLTKNNGLDPIELATAENKVASAQQAVDTANDNLAGATIIAPFDGTVLSVAGKAGDKIQVTAKKTSVTFVTLADLAHPLVQYSIDETDMSMVAVGEAATVIFDAMPNRTFKGTVTRVDPAVSTNNGAASVTGQIQLDLSQEKDLPAFPKNLSGSVQIIQDSVENALLIPVEALHEQGDGTYFVNVLGPDGQPAQKTVQIGLRDVASVEIKSGLSAGDRVVTSIVQ